ncbi:MAG: FAD binding domain-containing protein [Candidatus Methylomirabilales bacterium]
MTTFECVTPSTMDEAITLLGREGAKPIAGGTDLLIYMRAGEASPRYLIDLTGLGLSYVREGAGVIKIGATTTFAELLDWDPIRRNLPCLAEAAARIGGVQTRTVATVGGNLCSAVPSADSAPPLLVHDSRVKIAGRKRERILALEQFFAGPQKTVLEADEMLAEIQVPVPPPRTGTSFLKLGRRKALTLAIVNAAALVSLGEDGRTLESVRIALGAVAPTPVRLKKVEHTLQGRTISESLIDEAATTAADETAPISDLRATAEYRRAISRVLVKRALVDAWGKAAGEGGYTWSGGKSSRRVKEQPEGLSVKPPTASVRQRDRGLLLAEHHIELRVNGRLERLIVKPRALLMDVLRDQLGLTGTKTGCGTGECGACTVLLDGRPVNSCLTLAIRAQNRDITTIEGLGTLEDLHPLQEAFIVQGAVQCGFCAPGVLLVAKALLEKNPNPTEQEIRYAISGNICRCTGYVKIVESIKAAAQVMAQGGGKR